jgi:hypothetical protein
MHTWPWDWKRVIIIIVIGGHTRHKTKITERLQRTMSTPIHNRTASVTQQQKAQGKQGRLSGELEGQPGLMGHGTHITPHTCLYQPHGGYCLEFT